MDNKKIPDKSGIFLVVQLEEQLLGIDGVLVQSDHDSVDNADDATQTTGHNSDNDTGDSLLGLTEHEAVNTETAQQPSQNDHQPLILAANFHK